jgi:hypothetical protein
VRLDIPRLKAEVLRWRGGVRYGGANLVVSGILEESGSAALSAPVLRVTETGQRFRLRVVSGGISSAGLLPGQRLRVAGRVIKGGERSNDEIVLEPERVELAPEANGPR